MQDVRVIHAISARGTRCACPVASPPALTRPWANSPDPSWLVPAAGARVIRPYRRSITRQRWRTPSPLRRHPMPKRAAVRSQIRRASKLPRYPHGHVMETISSRPTVRRLDAASVLTLGYSAGKYSQPINKEISPLKHASNMLSVVARPNRCFSFVPTPFQLLYLYARLS